MRIINNKGNVIVALIFIVLVSSLALGQLAMSSNSLQRADAANCFGRTLGVGEIATSDIPGSERCCEVPPHADTASISTVMT